MPCNCDTPPSHPRNLVSRLGRRHCDDMRVVLLLALLISLSCTAPTAAEDALGVWQVRPDHSTGPYPVILAVRFEKHVEGEVSTLDTVDGQSWSATSSTIIYF